jgi:hypothetical protein
VAATRSAFFAAQPSEGCGWRLDAARQRCGLREIVQVSRCSVDLSGRVQLFQRCPFGKWCQPRHRPSPIGDLDGLTLFDQPE